jgi:hypothetical protein
MARARAAQHERSGTTIACAGWLAAKGAVGAQKARSEEASKSRAQFRGVANRGQSHRRDDAEDNGGTTAGGLA